MVYSIIQAIQMPVGTVFKKAGTNKTYRVKNVNKDKTICLFNSRKGIAMNERNLKLRLELVECIRL